MKHIIALKPSLTLTTLCALSLTSFIAPTESLAACKETVITFQQPGTYEYPANDVTMQLHCMGDAINLPERTLMHFMWQDAHGRVCYQDRSCGNVASWGMFVSVGGIWTWFGSMSSFVSSQTFDTFTSSGTTDYWGGALNLRVRFDYDQIERHCSDISQKICL